MVCDADIFDHLLASLDYFDLGSVWDYRYLIWSIKPLVTSLIKQEHATKMELKKAVFTLRA